MSHSNDKLLGKDEAIHAERDSASPRQRSPRTPQATAANPAASRSKRRPTPRALRPSTSPPCVPPSPSRQVSSHSWPSCPAPIAPASNAARRSPSPQLDVRHAQRFSVNTHAHTFHCFKCNRSGNALDLWAQTQRLSIYDAAMDLCQRLNIPLPILPRAANREQRRGTRGLGFKRLYNPLSVSRDVIL